LILKKYKPNFKLTDSFEIEPLKYNMMMAWSVFTHLSPENIKLCVKNASKVMADNCKFFATFFLPRGSVKFGRLPNTGPTGNWVYPFSFLEEVAEQNDLKAKHLKGFKHPTNKHHSMVMFIKNK